MSLLVLDVACLIGSFAFAGLVYPVRQGQPLMMLAAVVPVYLAAAVSYHAYSVAVSAQINKGLIRALHALLITASIILLAAFYFKATDQFSRVIFGLGFSISAVVLVIARGFFLRWARSLLGGNPYNVALITDNPHAFPAEAFSIIVEPPRFHDGGESPQMYNTLAMALRHADRVVLDCHPDHRMVWAHALQGANVQAEIITPELAQIVPRGLGQFGELPTIVVARGPLGLFDRGLKRAFDLAVAGSAVLLLAPVLALVAVAIRLETRGPVFFVQDRIGRSNRIFKVFKFRSMRVERADGIGNTSTRRDDDRITRVGRLIRKTSIDELPQLFNVLRGDMSIVGPRPHALGSRAEGDLFWEIDARYWHRHAAKPGLTGLAQVRGFRGATNLRTDLVNRLHADLEYLSAWSLWLDIKIILMTFRVVVHENAY